MFINFQSVNKGQIGDLCNHFIYSLISRFYEVQPNIEINIYEEVLGGAAEAISSGRADLAIGAGAESTPGQNIKYKKNQPVEWFFVVAPGHELTTAALPLNQAPQSRRIFSNRPVLSVPSITEKNKRVEFRLRCRFPFCPQGSSYY